MMDLIKLEDYLSTLNNFNSRKILTKFRISDHKLEIEIGRYKKVPREQRICKACKVFDNKNRGPYFRNSIDCFI
jgi:hypothetical protein